MTAEFASIHAPRAVDELMTELVAEEETIRLPALAAFFHPQIDTLPQCATIAARLNDVNPNARVLAVVLLGRMGAPAAQDLAATLDKTQPMPVRAAAASALATIGASAVAATGALCEVLGDKDAPLRTAAALALSKIGDGAVPALTSLLGQAPLPVEALLALAWIGQPAASAAQHLHRLAPTLTGESRVACYIAHAGTSGDIAPSLPVLTQCYTEGDEATRKMVVEQIGLLRAVGTPATPLLIKALQDTDASVRAVAAMGLARVDAAPSVAIPVLTQCLQDRSPEVQTHAAIALAFWREKASSALPALQLLSGSVDAPTSATARAAIRSIRGETNPPVS